MPDIVNCIKRNENNKSTNFKKYTVLLIYIAIVCCISSANSYAQFLSQIDITNVTATTTSGEKPQSKVWKYNNTWWAVIPDGSGTWLRRLDGNSWIKILKVSTSSSAKADTKVVGDKTYILLYRGTSSQLATVQHSPSNNEYTLVGSLSNISFGSGVETATIDIDSNSRMWLAYESGTNINVQWSDSPYSSWSSPIILGTGVNGDDIAAITAFNDNTGSKIGVMWSNQISKKFMFAYHVDGASVNTWTTETAATTPGGAPSGGIADDHINFAVASDGTIYAAVKTGYDTDGETSVGLLVRKPTGTWDNLYRVRVQNGSTRQPTRPIALLDEVHSKIYVIYTQKVLGNDIIYKYSSTSSINFPTGDGTLLIANIVADWDDASSTKQNFSDEVVILVSSPSGSTWTGVEAGTSSLPVELVFFTGSQNGSDIDLRWRTETEVNNYGFDIERTTDISNWMTVDFVEGNGNSNSPKQYNFSDTNIIQSGRYYYRLKQINNDGTYEYSDVVSIEVDVPNKYYLSQNYPNPFNPETRIEFTLPQQQFVSLKVYNTLGEMVAELVNEQREAGSYSVVFNASNLTSGIYIYRLRTSSFSANKKMTLLK
jgi:Secretion system C-terminal sorting domain